ncbi:hypothetical protein SUGI_0190080 [Cryptomeria japonica]|nr:hypothetical protein SUGI_0190080 [Cryptomeria japonica]
MLSSFGIRAARDWVIVEWAEYHQEGCTEYVLEEVVKEAMMEGFSRCCRTLRQDWMPWSRPRGEERSSRKLC